MQNSKQRISVGGSALQRLVLVGLTGAVAGIDSIAAGLAYSVLIFSGPLAEYLSIGISLGLWATLAVLLTTTLFSSLPGVVAQTQEVPAILLTVMLSALVVDSPEAAVLPTALVLIALASLSVGLLSWLLGHFRLGDLVRFLPYPVIGGFLGGTGWLLTLGGLLVLTGLPHLSGLGVLLAPSVLLQWLPGLAFALAVLVLMRRYGHPAILPGLIVGSVILFYVMLGVTGTSLAEVGDRGLLIGPFTTVERWQPLQWSTLSQAQWPLIFQDISQLGVFLVVTMLVLLLNVSSLEVLVGQDIDLNRELKTAGIANLVSGLGGGIVGFHGLGLTALCHSKMKGHSRWVGGVAALCCAGVLLLGSAWLAVLPRFVLGGMVLYLGFDFLVDWLWLARCKLPLSDYLIVISIVLTIALSGVLLGVGLGLAIAVVLFVINYSRTEVIRHQLSGMTHHSHVARAPQQQRLLQENGQQIQILRLQGYLFFGTANALFKRVQQTLSEFQPDLPQFLVLDFHQVTGVDSSAVYSFVRLRQLAQPPLTLVFTQLKPSHLALLQQGGSLPAEAEWLYFFPNLDQGLEWCEAKLIEALSYRRPRHVPLPVLLNKLFTDPEQISPFMTYLEKRQVAEGSVLFQAGDPADCLYFLESGQMGSFQPALNGHAIRQQTYQAGTVLGATAFYREVSHAQTATAEHPSTVYCLRRTQLQAMVQHHPEAAATFQTMMLHQMAGHLAQAQADIRILLS